MNPPQSPRIVIVEDHDLLREELIYHLALNGLVATGVNCGFALDDILAGQAKAPDMIVLDINLPGENGLHIAQRLRNALPHLGIIILTARTKIADIIKGYDHGADIYLPKPISGEDLVSALNTLWKRLTRPLPLVFRLDTQTRLVSAPDGRRVALSSNESLILAQLAQASDNTLESYQLLMLLTDEDTELEKSYLEVLVSRLRKKLGEIITDHAVPPIKAVRGKGYQLTLHVEITQAG
ncbi:MAG: response regulator transcription factor [Candidatus Accumulibacter sp. UW25]|jgi:DNA-binding response OmpR family regulator